MGPSKNLGVDLGTSGGEWLFRQGDLVLGPVRAAQLVEKLYSGDVDGKTEVSLLGGSTFKKIGEVDFFKIHIAKAEAKQRVEAAARSEESKGRSKRNVRIGLVAVASLCLAGGMAWTAQYLAVHKPWKKVAEEIFEADLISVEPPIITRAKRHTEDEELVDYPQAGGPSGSEKVAKVDKKAEKPMRLASARSEKAERTERPEKAEKTAAKTGKMADESEEADGLQMASFDMAAINSVVSAKQKSVFPCLVAEAQKKPGLSAKIPIEFVIGNDGRVAKVWVDNPTFKEGSLPECLLKELQKWPFKPYPGERATVRLSFNIGKGH